MEDAPHVAMLVLDTPTPGYSETYGDFHDQLISVVSDAARKGTQDLRFMSYDVIGQDQYPSLKDLRNGSVSAVMFGGSRYDAFADDAWVLKLCAYIKMLITDFPHLPLIGICFGHQVIGRVLGCRVGRSLGGWENGITRMELTKEFRQNSEFMFSKEERCPTYWNIVESHQDIVLDLPKAYPEVVNVGTTEECKIQGLFAASQTLNLFTLQGHPEFTAASSTFLIKMYIMGSPLEREQKWILSNETMVNDGALMGQAIFAFISKQRRKYQEVK
ncbi:hypothetical protein BABINDRAFT_8982 [Babjeviella inositovora NRRL Y-12698]|uniref:Glutamine amidotransferase domain-containing protein n=1 Tax=Babjeviella inositovora NRRL Y-12698 TaxID=984486 RepID=A0A1E3QNS9_9ASCO|nr:uncharacterized protein BABINDRAFT_8982 [Babjeviella inositovora NRRL Y-12698]ODQ78742.1 hypothetical protein BABINDRAFT_8982 [Babjeviella inositovora NRRL Y-12698]